MRSCLISLCFGSLLTWATQTLSAQEGPPAVAGTHCEHCGQQPSTQLALGNIPPTAQEYSEAFVKQMVAAAREGDFHRGALVFSSAKFSCLACHRVGEHGGQIGPNLSDVGKKRQPEFIVESVFWPKRHIEKEFAAHRLITADGLTLQGYLQEENDQQLVLRDPATGKITTIPLDDIDQRVSGETLMPEGLTAGMTRLQQSDLICFLTSLGQQNPQTVAAVAELLKQATAHAHGPAKFEYDGAPLRPEDYPNHVEPINALRLYDYYSKQADYFRQQANVPTLLAEYPGLEIGGKSKFREVAGEIDPRWNKTQIQPVLSGIFHAGKVEVPRGVCVRLGDDGEMGTCFNPETLCYEALWKGKFLTFPGERRGFMNGLQPAGELLPRPAGQKPEKPFVYHGFYRHGPRVIFSYSIGNEEYLDAPWAEGGEFQRVVAPADQHPLRHLTQGGPAFWSEEIVCPIELGDAHPYAFDRIGLPFKNPNNDLMFLGGVAFLPEGGALVCTMQGDVWRADDYEFPSKEVRWRKVAVGMHQAQGIVADRDGVFVLGRDQITKLHDLNGDGEYDFHECFCNGYVTSTAGHDYICGLDRDAEGNFFIASGNEGLVKISPDGKAVSVIATGFRNPDGLGIMADGTVTVPCSQGTWTPASMICAVRPTEKNPADPNRPPFYGFGGPQKNGGHPPTVPLVYLPRGLDNSSAGQTIVQSDRWGPLENQLLHFSFGACRYFLVLTDEIDGQMQGAVVPLPGDFRSGVHRARFSPHDGQLYAAGQAGWGAFAVEDGSLDRVRYTGDPVQLPTGFRTYENGVRIDFSSPLDPSLATDVANQFAQCWNYRYTGAYGSPEFSRVHRGTPGHDVLKIQSAHVLENGRSLFLEIPEIQPVNQLHLRLRVNERDAQDLILTVHKLDKPFTQFAGYQAVAKTIEPHPILADLAFESKRVPNPWRKAIAGARRVSIQTAGNMQFGTRTLTAKAGESLQMTLENADVVPHNWVLVKPGMLEVVGEMANRLTADPDAYPKHYIPETNDVVAYVDIVDPGSNSTIYFKVPETPGQYPFVCTFPGHWTVMHGVLTVTKD